MTKEHENYINKNYVKELLKGGVFNDIRKLENAFPNFDKNDWKVLRLLGKKEVKDNINELIAEGVKNDYISPSQENEIRNFAYSLVNFSSSLFINEELMIEIFRLYKREVIDKQYVSEQEAWSVLFPILIEHLNNIVARKPKIKINNYHKTEVSLVGKINQLETTKEEIIKNGGELERILRKEEEFPNDSNKTKEKLDITNLLASSNKLVNILESITIEEIKVAKAKFKKSIYKVLSKQIPQAKPLLKSVLDLVDAIFGEDWVLEIAKFLGQIGKEFLKILTPQNIESFLKDNSNEISRINIIGKIFQQLETLGIEKSFKEIMVKITNHFNLLAREEAQTKNISLTEEQTINQKIITAPQISPGSRPTNGLGGFSFSASLPSINSIMDSDSDDSNPSRRINAKAGNVTKEILEEYKKSLGIVESKKPWYKDPWVYGLSALGLSAVILVYYLFFRKKNNK